MAQRVRQFLRLFFIAILISVGYAVNCNSEDCVLPNCFCPGLEGPPDIAVADVPQMVLLSFDDAVLPQFQQTYTRLFDSRRRNPNGCPIVATFYVSDNGTDYDLVSRLYARGHEMASHSVTHLMPQSRWTRATYQRWMDEIAGQRDNLARRGGVDQREVRGMRSPFLETGGDVQYDMLADIGLEYDSSFMVGPHGSSGGVWPFTMDVPPLQPDFCSNINCPQRPHPGIWQLPLNRWLGRGGRPCAMVDSCDDDAKPKTGDRGDALAYLWHNFGRFYRGNRAPFGIHLHASWLESSDAYFDAFERFVDALLNAFDDVYFVTSHQAIGWMKQPQTTQQARHFPQWRRSCSPVAVHHVDPHVRWTKSVARRPPKTAYKEYIESMNVSIKPLNTVVKLGRHGVDTDTVLEQLQDAAEKMSTHDGDYYSKQEVRIVTPSSSRPPPRPKVVTDIRPTRPTTTSSTLHRGDDDNTIPPLLAAPTLKSHGEQVETRGHSMPKHEILTSSQEKHTSRNSAAINISAACNCCISSLIYILTSYYLLP